MKSLTSSLFADGGMAFGARIIGASLPSRRGHLRPRSTRPSGAHPIWSQLDDAIAKLQAIAGATDTEMQKLSKSIFELG
jgi:hypothetical protein